MENITNKIMNILKEAKENEGKDFYGINYCKGNFYKSCIGSTKQITRSEAGKIIEKNLP